MHPYPTLRIHACFSSGLSAPPRFCKAGEGNELLCSRRCRWSASCARATATTSATCKAPGCGNLGILAARLREQARCGPHNTAVATDRDSTAAFIARPPHPVCYFQCTRAMPRDRRLPLWGVLCRCLTALQTTRRRASGSAHVLSHRLYPLQAMRLHILLQTQAEQLETRVRSLTAGEKCCKSSSAVPVVHVAGLAANRKRPR